MIPVRSRSVALVFSSRRAKRTKPQPKFKRAARLALADFPTNYDKTRHQAALPLQIILFHHRELRALSTSPSNILFAPNTRFLDGPPNSFRVIRQESSLAGLCIAVSIAFPQSWACSTPEYPRKFHPHYSLQQLDTTLEADLSFKSMSLPLESRSTRSRLTSGGGGGVVASLPPDFNHRAL